MNLTYLLNIFISFVILAAIVSLAWWILTQIFKNPEVQKWIKIIAACLLLVVLVLWLGGGFHPYPFLR